MIGIDLFSGCGGMTLGAKLAGVEVMYAVESDPHAAATYEFNNEDVCLFKADIRDVVTIPVSNRTPTIVFGGPPCQGFSTSNQRNRNSLNPNNSLYQEYFRIVKSLPELPAWIVFENVRGFTETENGQFLDKVIRQLKRLGYTVHIGVLNAANFGVPQRRSRVFIVGSRVTTRFEFPEVNSNSYVTVKEAIGDLPLLANGQDSFSLPYKEVAHSKYACEMRGDCQFSYNNHVTRNSQYVVERYEHVPQGGNWENIPVRLMQNYFDRTRCHTGIYHRLNPDQASVVIGNYRKNMLIHPFENRGLSVREAARLQSFPDWYIFKGSIGFQQQQVGNAVPPKLSEAIFKAIKNYS